MGAATEFRSPHRRDAPAYLSTVEDLITYLWTGYGLRLGATIAFEFGPDPGEREWRAIIIEREPDDVFLLVSGFVSGAYSAKLLAGTRHRLSGLSQPRQCGDDVLRMLVTGGPPLRGGGGIPQRIMISSRSPAALCTTGADRRPRQSGPLVPRSAAAQAREPFRPPGAGAEDRVAPSRGRTSNRPVASCGVVPRPEL
jgi:hypothetical protein